MAVILQPSRRGVAVVAVFSISAAIVSIVSALRAYVRLRIVKGQHTGYEDLAAGIAWSLFMLLSSIAIAGTFYGAGRYLEAIPPENLEDFFKIVWIYDICYIVAQMAVKHSISLMLLRFAVENFHKKVIHLVTFLVHAISIALIATVLLQCIPLSFFWTRASGDTDGRCLDPNVSARAAYVYSGIIVAYDVTMALLPWLMVRKLQLDLRTRLMVTIVLALGSVACIATIVRIPFIVKEVATRDVSRTQATVNMVSCAEMALSLAASSAATLKPLFQRGSAQSHSNGSGKTPMLSTIKSTLVGSSTGSSAREGDIEFSTAFYGGAK